MPNCLSTYTLAGIGFDCNANLAGVKKVWMTYYDNVDVSGAIDYETHKISAVTMSTGATWYTYDFARNTSSLNSTLTKDDSNGTRYFTNTLELFIVSTPVERIVPGFLIYHVLHSQPVAVSVFFPPV